MVYTGVSTVRSRKLNISNIQMLQMRMEMEFDDLCQRRKETNSMHSSRYHIMDDDGTYYENKRYLNLMIWELIDESRCLTWRNETEISVKAKRRKNNKNLISFQTDNSIPTTKNSKTFNKIYQREKKFKNRHGKTYINDVYFVLLSPPTDAVLLCTFFSQFVFGLAMLCCGLVVYVHTSITFAMLCNRSIQMCLATIVCVWSRQCQSPCLSWTSDFTFYSQILSLFFFLIFRAAFFS